MMTRRSSPKAENNSAQLEATAPGKFRLTGDLTFATAARLWQLSQKILKQSPDPVVIDLSAVQRIDSAGLALLIEWLRFARKYNTQLTFLHCPEQLVTMAGVHDLEDLLPCVNG